MNKKKIKLVFTLSLLLLIAMFIANSVLRVSSYDVLNQGITTKDFSNGDYKVFFSKGGRGPNGDGTIQEIYSVNSDGTDLMFEKNESSEKWSREVQGYGISESMGNFHGDFRSLDKTKEFTVNTGLFNTGWFAMLTKPKLYVTKKGSQKKLLWKKGFGEAVWLPDSRRVVVASDKIYIIDSETGKYTYLTDSYGWMIRVESNSR